MFLFVCFQFTFGWFIHSHSFGLSPPDNCPIYMSNIFLPHLHSPSVFLYYFKIIIPESTLAKLAPPTELHVVKCTAHHPGWDLGCPSCILLFLTHLSSCCWIFISNGSLCSVLLFCHINLPQ